MKVSLALARRFGPYLDLLLASLGWLLVAPLTFIVPRRRNLVVFFGRDGGKFTDNCKHLFAAATRDRDRLGIDPVFLARDGRLRDQLERMGARAELAGSIRGMGTWLRAGTIVVDNIDWIRGLRFPASRGARLVQLWHGIPLKQVQLPLFRARLGRVGRFHGALLRVHRAVTGRYARSDWFLSTASLVTDKAFAGSFRFDRVSHAGYPRNDAMFDADDAMVALGADPAARAAVAAHRASGRPGRIGLYAPTFRYSLEDPFGAGGIDLGALSDVARETGMLLLVKLHPWMHGRAQATDLPGLHFVSPESDIYPLLREVDFLVTDYSSIFFDFLLLDRPVVFFPYDLETYLASERPMYFDYAAMTPGPKAGDIATLADALREVAAGRDGWSEARARVRDLVFTHQDGLASRRLLAELFGNARG